MGTFPKCQACFLEVEQGTNKPETRKLKGRGEGQNHPETEMKRRKMDRKKKPQRSEAGNEKREERETH